jgi:hypothetical protein
VGGAVVLCSEPFGGDSGQDDAAGGPSASDLRVIRRGEALRMGGMPDGTYTLIGSRGYNYDDLRRAVHELAQGYATRYLAVQNIIIPALDAWEAWRLAPRRCLYPAPGRRAVQTFLAPAAGHANDEALAAEALTVLVHI